MVYARALGGMLGITAAMAVLGAIAGYVIFGRSSAEGYAILSGAVGLLGGFVSAFVTIRQAREGIWR